MFPYMKNSSYLKKRRTLKRDELEKVSNGKNEKIKIDNVLIRANELYFIIKNPKE